MSFFILLFWMLCLTLCLLWLTCRVLNYQLSWLLLIVLVMMWFLRAYLAAFSEINPLITYYPDTELYMRIIQQNFYVNDESMGVSSYYFLTYPIRLLSVFNLNSFLVFQTFLYFAGMIFLWKAYLVYIAFNNCVMSKDSLVFYVLIFSLYPASVAYISIPLREFMILFFLSIFIYGLVVFLCEKKITILIVSFLFLVSLRVQLFPILLAAVFISKYNTRWYHFLFYFILPSIGVYILSKILYTVTPEALSYKRNLWYSSHGEQVYGVFEWYSWLDVVSSLPSLYSQFLLSPLPVLHNLSPASMIMGLIDVIFLMPLYLSLLLWGRRYGVFNPFLVVFLVVSVGSAIWEAHIGGAIRHRMVVVVVLFPLYAHMIERLIKRIFNKKKTHVSSCW